MEQFKRQREQLKELPQVDYSDTCLVCCEPLKFVSLFPCNHKLCCALCVMKLRVIDKDKKCVLCKQESEIVFVANFTAEKSFKDFQLDNPATNGWFEASDGNQEANATKYALLIQKFDLLEDPISQMFFEKANGGEQEFKKLIALREFRCDVEDCRDENHDFKTLAALNGHLSRRHQLNICKYCAAARRQFIMELPRRSTSELSLHTHNGSAKEGIPPHPKCGFCSTKFEVKGEEKSSPLRFYDNDALYLHLKEKHEYCHVCRKEGRDFQYFIDRPALFAHFKEKHYVCEHPDCVDMFQAFATDADLKAHIIANHPDMKVDRAIQTNFFIKRQMGNDNRQDFDTLVSTSRNAFNGIHPQSFQFAYRPEEFPTALTDQERAFTNFSQALSDSTSPTNLNLNENTSSSSGPGIWALTAGSASGVTGNLESEELFPSLSSASSRKRDNHMSGFAATAGNMNPKTEYTLQTVLGPYAKHAKSRKAKTGFKVIKPKTLENPYGSFTEAVHGVTSLNLNELSRNTWDEQRSIKSASQRNAEILVPSRDAVPIASVKNNAPRIVPVASHVVIPEAVAVSLGNHEGALFSLRTMLNEYNDSKLGPKKLYGDMQGLYKAHSDGNLFHVMLPTLLDLIGDTAKRKDIMELHEEATLFTSAKSNASLSKLNYLNPSLTKQASGSSPRKVAMTRNLEEEFPTLASANPTNTSASVTWGPGSGPKRINGKLDIDSFLKEAAAARKKNGPIGLSQSPLIQTKLKNGKKKK